MKKLTEKDVLFETIDYYLIKGNALSISINGGDERCLYHGSNGERCAFSRCCEENVNLSKYEDKSASEIIKKEGIEVLKEEYRHLYNIYFWNSIQYIHDKCMILWKSDEKCNIFPEYFNKYKREVKELVDSHFKNV